MVARNGTLEIRHLRIIDAVARAGTVTEAARRLGLTQPAVSHALGELESRLGVKLFDRERRGMTPTTEGERLVRTAEAVLTEVECAEQDLELYRDGFRGIIRLATECYTCYHWLPPLLSRFRDRFPEVAVELSPDASSDPAGALEAEKLDAAIMHTDVSSRPGLRPDFLFQDELVVVMRPGHPLAEKEWLEADDFAEETLFLHTGVEDSTIVQSVLEPAGVSPARVHSLYLTEAIVESVAAGLGISVLARWAAAPAVDAGRLASVPVGEDGLFRKWWVVTRRRDRNRAALSNLVGLLRESRLPASFPGG